MVEPSFSFTDIVTFAMNEVLPNFDGFIAMYITILFILALIDEFVLPLIRPV